MDNSDGGFHEIEKDGKLFMVYDHPKYHPIPQIKNPSSSIEVPSHDHPPQPLFLCPNARYLKELFVKTNKKQQKELYGEKVWPLSIPVNSSPEYVFSTTRVDDHHHVLPLFWCNNEKFDVNGGCSLCCWSYMGTNYYFCDYCDSAIHKECVESPIKIKHPYHSEHSLQLYMHNYIVECFYCGNKACNLVYCCTICQAFMHPICAMRLVSFVIDKPKSHEHPLTFFPRQTSLTCNVCGLLRKNFPTYVCLRCNFVAHNDCMYSPRLIKISCHPHRLSYIYPLPLGQRSCGVCRQGVKSGYGAYRCVKSCSDYAVHSRCALERDVCDGEELEDVPEDDDHDITLDDGPFVIISEGVIRHFLHDHHLRLEVIVFYDENKLCEACSLPIFEGNLYKCIECDFIVHELCAKFRRRIQHVLHPHPLKLYPRAQYVLGPCPCWFCLRYVGGFFYWCDMEDCDFVLDVTCALISEPFHYKGHEHPLFIPLDKEVKPICHICKTECRKQLNCIKCDFIVCFNCATLPYRASYRNEKHFLTVLSTEDVCKKDWCELCEGNIKDTDTKVFYWCNECCATFHIGCLLGEDLYLTQGHSFEIQWKEGIEKKAQVLRTYNFSQPLCDYCKNPCKGKIFMIENEIVCSLRPCGSKIYARDVNR